MINGLTHMMDVLTGWVAGYIYPNNTEEIDKAVENLKKNRIER